MKRDGTPITREVLYEQARTVPMATLGKQYGLSDVGLAKICKKLRVPVPGRGYWARKQAGQSVRQTPLGKLPANAVRSMREVVIRSRTTDPSVRTPNGRIATQPLVEREAAHKVRVALVLEDPHSLVAQSVLALRRSKPGAKGVLDAKPGTCLDVRVSAGSVDRSMRILDALVKALEGRGFPVTIGADKSNVTRAHIDDEDVPFHLEERLLRVERKPAPTAKYSWPTFEWISTGELVLRIDHYDCRGIRQSWADGKKQRLEACLNDFIVGLVAGAQLIRQRRLEHEERMRARQVEEARRAAVQRRREFEQGRIRTLHRVLDDWQNAQLIRAYVADARRALMGAEPTSDLARWLSWVEEYAERIDPFKPTPHAPAPAATERPDHLSWMAAPEPQPLFDPEES